MSSAKQLPISSCPSTRPTVRALLCALVSKPQSHTRVFHLPPHGRLHPSVSDTFRVPELPTSAVLTSKRAKCVVQSCASPAPNPLATPFCMFAIHTLLLRQQNHCPRVPPAHCEHLRFPHVKSTGTPWRRQSTQPRCSNRVPHCVVCLASLAGATHCSELSSASVCPAAHGYGRKAIPNVSVVALWPRDSLHRLRIGPSFLVLLCLPIEACNQKNNG